jgi:hypothetical protein
VGSSFAVGGRTERATWLEEPGPASTGCRRAGSRYFPHIYGALAVSAVTEAVALSRDASGSVSIGGGPISR